MKKIYLFLVMATVAFSSYAQKGMQGVGMNVGAYHNPNTSKICPSFDVKYMYNLSNWGRIEFFGTVSLDPDKKSKLTRQNVEEELNGGDGKKMGFIFGVSYHQFLRKAHRARPYLILGVGYGMMHLKQTYSGSYPYMFNSILYEVAEYPMSEGGLIFRLGLGLDYRISHYWSLQTELAGAYFKEGIIPQLKIGFTRNF